MAINDVYVGDIHMRLQDNPNLYCFFYQITVENDETAAARDVAVHLKDVVAPLLIAFHTPAVIFRCSTGREVWPASSIVEVQDINDLPGDDTPNLDHTTLPGQVSLLAHLYGNAADPNKSNRGRDFLHGFSTQDCDNGIWQTSILSSVQNFYEVLPKTFTSVNQNTFAWGHFSLTQAAKTVGQNGNPPVDPLAKFFWNIELIRLHNLARTQRRRQPEDPCQQYVTFDPRL